MAVSKKTTAKKSGEASKSGVKVQLVVMVRDDGKTADVHPNEVENFKLGGYKVTK